jgi:hypothetical protein
MDSTEVIRAGARQMVVFADLPFPVVNALRSIVTMVRSGFRDPDSALRLLHDFPKISE